MSHINGFNVNDPSSPLYLQWLSLSDLLVVLVIHTKAKSSVMIEITTRHPDRLLFNSHKFITSETRCFTNAVAFINNNIQRDGRSIFFGVSRITSPIAIYCIMINPFGHVFCAPVESLRFTKHMYRDYLMTRGDWITVRNVNDFMTTGDWITVSHVNELLDSCQR